MTAPTLRDMLIESCRRLRAFLTLTLSERMRLPDQIERYQGRWLRLDAALAQFQDNPANFDSRYGVVGLAERIHRVEPTKMLEGTGRAYFLLKAPKSEKDSFPPGAKPPKKFTPSDLAKTLEKAYKLKGHGDAHVAGVCEIWGEYYESDDVDLICSELNDYFNGLAEELRIYEEDQAIAALYKSENIRDSYEKTVIQRSMDQDPYITQIFARKCCEFCFRLIPERSGKIGKTCDLHDPKKNRSLYNSAGVRRLNQQKIFEEQRKKGKIDVEANSDNPEFVPWRLHVEMKLFLSNTNGSQILDDGLFGLTYSALSSEKKKEVDIVLLRELVDKVRDNYPKIARPDQFATRIQALIDQSKHTPEELTLVFGWFVFDEYIPLHPNLIAICMRMFLEESWFAQEYDPDYYGVDRGKGRPQKIDPQAVIAAAEKIKLENPKIGSKLSATLAEMFSCTPTRIRQLLKPRKSDSTQG